LSMGTSVCTRRGGGRISVMGVVGEKERDEGDATMW
jgi:hypothetical protein